MSKGLLSFAKFGRWGRAGNQFFQYAFLTQYAEKYDLSLQLPRWCGCELFGSDYPEVTTHLPDWIESESGLSHPIPPIGEELVNHNFCGYAQYHTKEFSINRSFYTRFTPVRDVAARLHNPKRRLLETGITRIGIHLRRGDYGRRIFPIVPTSWYLQWLKENWHRFAAPSLFIATEDPSLVNEFQEYTPQTTETLGVGLNDKPMADCVYLKHDLQTKDRRALDWYPDFYLLSNCDVILGPSSTFSFFAAMLNPLLREYWRGSLAAKAADLRCAGFTQTDPWNDYPLLREHCRDYPQLKGITSDPSNPYW